MIIVLVLFLMAGNIFAQLEPELPLILDHPGTFEILSRTDYTLPECGFTKSEIKANLKRITELVNTVCKNNPVLNNISGFDGRARIYNISGTAKGNYGIPARISFEFASWYRKKDGTATRGFIEPPEWSLIINRLKPTGGWHFSADLVFDSREYFIIPGKKETVDSGIDVYEEECFILYNPNRPPYWLPVTINEVFTYLKDKWENDPNKIAAAEILKMIKSGYDTTPVTDLDKPAYYGGGSPISIVSSDNQYPPVMRINPAYWDKSLPKSAIQFIYFRSVPNKDYYRKLKEEYLQNNSISYNLARFEESFDMENIRSLVPLIGK